jgi:hypothetical protein
MVHQAVAVTTTRVPVGALSSKVAASASGSKGVASAKKMVMPIRKHHVPATGVMAVASSEESQESSPHGRAARDSTTKIMLRSEPRGQSSQASLPSSLARLEPEAPLKSLHLLILAELQFWMLLLSSLQINQKLFLCACLCH